MIKNKNHFKRRNNGIKSKLIIIGLMIILIILVKNYLEKDDVKEYDATDMLKKEESHKLETATLQAEADISKAVLEARASKAKRYVNSVSDEIEFIPLSESGEYSITHSRLDKKAGLIQKAFSNSHVKVYFNYTAIFSIKTTNITIYQTDGNVYINYDPANILVKSIEVDDATTKTKKSIFGKEYSNQEVLSLVDIAKDEIRNQLTVDDKLKMEACTNLNSYFEEMGKKMNLDGLYINSKEVIQQTYTFINNGTVKHNHSNKPLEKVEYIVIHSTACKDVRALTFYDNLNNYVQKREASANFYVDYENVVQAIPPNMQSWNCACKNPLILANNQNTLAVEICEFTNPDYQQKAIENAVKFVKEVLAVQFPDAKIVMHREVNAKTACPSILTNDEFNDLFRKE